MIDHFDKDTFEKALPVDRRASISPMIPAYHEKKLWRSIGLVKDEWCYVVPVKEGVEILIRSSVGAGGHSAGTGEDSIRCYLVDDIDRKPLGPKLSKYVTRVPGWQRRMTETLRALWRLGRMLGLCPACKLLPLHLQKVKKAGPNKGRLFVSCPCGKHFKWADTGDNSL